eukprot:1674611-Prymnesium_polylepis.1
MARSQALPEAMIDTAAPPDPMEAGRAGHALESLAVQEESASRHAASAQQLEATHQASTLFTAQGMPSDTADTLGARPNGHHSDGQQVPPPHDAHRGAGASHANRAGATAYQGVASAPSAGQPQPADGARERDSNPF